MDIDIGIIIVVCLLVFFTIFDKIIKKITYLYWDYTFQYFSENSEKISSMGLSKLNNLFSNESFIQISRKAKERFGSFD